MDRQGLRPTESKLAATARLTPPTAVEEVRTFLELTGSLGQYVERHRVLAAPFKDMLRNTAFAFKIPRRPLTTWTELYRHALTSSPIPAFPAWDTPFVLHTDRSAAWAGGALTQEIEGAETAIAYASHRQPATDEQRGATERECMSVLWEVARLFGRT